LPGKNLPNTSAGLYVQKEKAEDWGDPLLGGESRLGEQLSLYWEITVS